MEKRPKEGFRPFVVKCRHSDVRRYTLCTRSLEEIAINGPGAVEEKGFDN